MADARVSRKLAWWGLWLWLVTAQVFASDTFARWSAVYDDARVRGATALAQTPDGFLWVGSESGLLRFDGQTWYEERGGRPQALTINDLLVDPRGTLWVGSGNTLLRYALGSLQTAAKIDLPHATIRRLRWIGGAVYLATSVGVYRFDPIHGLVQLGNPSAAGAYDVAVDAGGKGLLAVNHAGVFIWHGPDWRRRSVDGAGQLVTSLQQDASGTMWLGGYTLRTLQTDGRVHEDDGPARRIRRLAMLSNGELWVGTHSDGIYIRSRDGHWRAGSKRLRGELISAILEDKDGGVWVAAGTGLHRFELGGSEWITTADGLPTTLIASVAVDKTDAMWVATYGSGLLKVDATNALQPVATPCGDMLLSLAWQAPNTLWIGGEAGLCRYRDARIEYLPEAGEVQAVAAASDGGQWVLNREALLHLRDGRVDRRVARPDRGELASMFYLQDAGDGSVWLASAIGVARVDQNGWRNVDTQGEVTALLAFSPQYAWALQAGNVVLLLQDGRRYVQSALPGAWLLWRDTEGSLWQISRSGRARVNEQLLRERLQQQGVPPRWEQFSANPEQDGVQPSQIGTPSIAAATAGRVVLAALGQVRVGRLQPSLRRLSPPQAELLSVSSEEVSAAQPGQKFAAGSPIQFQFIAASLHNPQALRFRYRLLPLNKGWSSRSAERSVSFAQLPPGSYVFEVQACLPGVDGVVPARFAFHVMPQWYQLVWVRLLGMLVLVSILGAAIVLFLRWRMERLVARKRELEAEVSTRTRELAEANQRLAALASTDALTGLANRRAFHDASQRAWPLAHELGGSVAVLMIDVDFFKGYNDKHGHAAGDEVLRSVAQTLAASVDVADALVARYGGEEFVALLPRLDLTAALTVAESIRKSVEALAIPHHGRTDLGSVTVSIGAAASTRHDAAIDSVLARADMALYTAKSSGRNWVCGG